LLTIIGVLTLSMLAVVTLALKGWYDHRENLALRGRMLDDCAALFGQAEISVGSDGFPVLTGKIGDGRLARIDLIADTLVTRRLPQLWLRLTIIDRPSRRDFSVGALARATGAEFYSIVAEMPERFATFGDLPLLVRGKRVPKRIESIATPLLINLFADARLKEAAVTPNGVRIVRQASEGDRASHILLRQVRFGDETVPNETLRLAIENATSLEVGLIGENRVREMT